ncbi:MAG: hypothetical protein M3Z05_12490 [Gemmatimonadota bacterium]|nr:hypothetical protein [Gemmatimonadota bacterium]
MTDASAFLRHTLATLAYRAGKAIRATPADFSAVRAAPDSRTAGELLAHMSDLLDWALSLARGKQQWADAPVQSWEADTQRFFRALEALDAQLSTDAPLGMPAERLFQGAVADALTHTGQLTMLRRLAGAPIRAENYAKADIVVGRVGAEQTPARHEF